MIFLLISCSKRDAPIPKLKAVSDSHALMRKCAFLNQSRSRPNRSPLGRTVSLTSKFGYRKLAVRDTQPNVRNIGRLASELRDRDRSSVAYVFDFAAVPRRCGRTPLRPHWLAGAPGFEPGNGGIKIRCLTTWLRPNAHWDCRPGRPHLRRHRRAGP